MARSSSGLLMGRAAYEQRRDLEAYNYEMWVQEQRQLLIDRENRLFDYAITLPNFEPFWDSVPDFGKRSERIDLLRAFIASERRLAY